MKKYLQSLLITASIIIGIGIVPVPTASAQADNTYSCGGYGSSQYSRGECNTTNVTPPNTGFAKLMKPDYLLPIIGFLAIAILGTIIVIKTRKHH